MAEIKPTTPTPPTTGGTNNTSRIALVAVGLLLIAGMGFFGWKYTQEKKTNEQKTEEITELNTEITDLEKKVDDLQLTIDDQSLKMEEKDKLLAEKYREIQGLLGQVGKAKNNDKVDKTRISELEVRLTTMSQQIEEYRQKIAQLENQNQQLTTAVTELKQTEMKLTQEKTAVEQAKAQTQSQLETTKQQASVLKIGDFGFSKVNKKGEKDPDVEFKGSGLKPLKIIEICFSVFENQFAATGKKDVFLVIQDPKGNTLSNTSGYSGSFTGGGAQRTYSCKTSIQYENSRKRQCVTFEISDKTKFEKGTHTVYTYLDGVVSGQGSFEVK